jgi:eukaryotic-like serine/threonine-protein kinase
VNQPAPSVFAPPTVFADGQPSFAERLNEADLGDWVITGRLEAADADPDLSGGFFSVGYAVKHKDNGTDAFLKAFDLKRVLSQQSGMGPAEGLMRMTIAFQFERLVLQSAKRMDRVVQLYADGEVWVESSNPFSWVPYLILEKADRDARRHLRDIKDITVAQRLELLHHVATGLMQLHGAQTAHQDLKPSNVLVWDKGGAKVGDLGRCSVLGGSMNPYDLAPFAGDWKYAPPEVLYNHLDPDWFARRLPIDLYLFGSIIVFLFTQVSMSSLMIERFLNEEHRPGPTWNGRWTGTFVEVLPYLENAFVDAVQEFERCLPAPKNPRKDYRPRLVQIVRDMCHPDPTKRGTLIRQGERTHNLGRIVTMLDVLYYDA